MMQPDLFAYVAPPRLGEPVCVPAAPVSRTAPAQPMDQSVDKLDLPTLLERLARMSRRPRYTFMVLNLIARAAGNSDHAGPMVREGDRFVPIRDWLTDALLPIAQRDARRLTIVKEVRSRLIASGTLPADPTLAEEMIGTELRERLRTSGRTNVSRAVSDLVRAGLLQRHYQGYRVDHCNRGAQREAVYTIPREVRRALSATSGA